MAGSFNSSMAVGRKTGVDLWGNAVIPQGTQELSRWDYDGNAQLRFARLPASVRTLRSRTFADCKNLETVQLNEGLERIEANVFTGCSRLYRLEFPDSIRHVEAYAFYNTHLREPVYNRSKTAFHHYPNRAVDKTFTMPATVKRVFPGAFFNNTALEEVILPEGLEEIHCRAFMNTEIRRITIPASVKKIHSRAFWGCKALERVELLCEDTALEYEIFLSCPNVQVIKNGKRADFDFELRLRGIPLLGRLNGLRLPEGSFEKDEAFRALSARCGSADTSAMLEFADYFEHLGEHPFFACAANFWRHRAAQYADPQGIQWKDSWMAEHPRERIPSVIGEDLQGVLSGQMLRSLGFPFFEPEREYSLRGIDENGIVQVDSWCGDDGPDEDGYGREEYYDWWLLDEFLQPIPGIPKWHSYSRQDMRQKETQWNDLREKAGKIVKHRSSHKTPQNR